MIFKKKFSIYKNIAKNKIMIKMNGSSMPSST